jgi:hypothetical protein
MEPITIVKLNWYIHDHECCRYKRAFLPYTAPVSEDFSDDLERKRTGLRRLAGAIAPPATAAAVPVMSNASDSAAVAEPKPTTSTGDRATAKSSHGRK